MASGKPWSFAAALVSLCLTAVSTESNFCAAEEGSQHSNGEPQEKWEIDKVLDVTAEVAFIWLIVGACLLVAFLLVLVASFMVDFIQGRPAPVASCLFPCLTSYLGLTYVTFVLTVPLFGLPEHAGYPQLPHLHPSRPDSTRGDALVNLLYNGLWLAFFAYVLIVAIILVVGVCIMVPLAMLTLLLLVAICRVASHVDGMARSLTQSTSLGSATVGKANHEGGAVVIVACIRLCSIISRMFVYSVASTAKTGFDLLLMVSVSLTWPTFAVPFQIDWTLTLDFEIPCLKLPRIEYDCAFTEQLHELLVLATTIVVVASIISSDIMVMLYDRIGRSKMAQFNVFSREERPLWFKHQLVTSSLDGCTMVCWKCVEIIISLSTAALARSAVLLFSSRRSRGSEEVEHEECQLGFLVISKALAAYVLVATFVQVLRVATGHVHRNNIYICTFPLVESGYSIWQISQFQRLFIVVMMTVGSFLLPFVNLGMREDGTREVEQVLSDESPTCDHSHFSMMSHEQLEDQKWRANRAGKRLAAVFAHTDATFRQLFGAGALQQETLVGLHRYQRTWMCPPKQRRLGRLGNLEIGAVSILEYVKALEKAEAERRKSSWCSGASTVGKMMIGVFDKGSMKSMQALGRSQLWQSQMEAVQLASGNYLAITFQIVPVVGIFAGKITQYLNEHPTWVVTKLEAEGGRSFRWSGSGKACLRPGVRMLLLYMLSVVKIGLLLAAFFTGELVICFTIIFATYLLEFLVSMIFSEHSRLNTVKPADTTEDHQVTAVMPVVLPNPCQKEEAFTSPTPNQTEGPDGPIPPAVTT